MFSIVDNLVKVAWYVVGIGVILGGTRVRVPPLSEVGGTVLSTKCYKSGYLFAF